MSWIEQNRIEEATGQLQLKIHQLAQMTMAGLKDLGTCLHAPGVGISYNPSFGNRRLLGFSRLKPKFVCAFVMFIVKVNKCNFVVETRDKYRWRVNPNLSKV